MLKAVRDDIKKNYYDPQFRGIDLEARTTFAEERIKQAKTNAEIFGVIAQFLLEFKDSHTLFTAATKCTSRIWLANADLRRRLLRHRRQTEKRR
jgi:hypothetical protein